MTVRESDSVRGDVLFVAALLFNRAMVGICRPVAASVAGEVVSASSTWRRIRRIDRCGPGCLSQVVQFDMRHATRMTL
jgi:hypothetical protein